MRPHFNEFLPNIDEASGEYKLTLDQIDENFKEWNINKKNLIFHTLNNYADGYRLKWRASINDEILGRETISLAFDNAPSRFSYNKDNLFNQQNKLSGHLLKEGATLNFSILPSGMVGVWMSYPHYPDLTDGDGLRKELGRVGLNELGPDGQVIANFIRIFLKECTDWEGGMHES